MLQEGDEGAAKRPMAVLNAASAHVNGRLHLDQHVIMDLVQRDHILANR